MKTFSGIHLPNVRCVYCHAIFGSELLATDEHVVGRRFVPKGTLAGAWNLVVNACEPCNQNKATFESDLLALTMQPDVFGRFPVADLRLELRIGAKRISDSSRDWKIDIE